MKKLLMAALLALTFALPAQAVCPAAPTLQLPANNAEVSFGNVLLNWSDVPNATFYEVYLGLDGDPTSLHTTTTNSQVAIEVEPGRTVQWKVGAGADACATQYPDYFFFTTSCPTVVPVLQEPDPGEQFAPGQAITFDWTPMNGATSYDVVVTPDFGETFATIAENLTASQHTTDELPEGDWGWYVRVNFDGACGPFFSQPSHFLITSCSTAEAPRLVAPANNATVTQPATFQWSDVGAKEYRLYVEMANRSPQMVGSTTSTSLVVDDLDGGTYAWWVVARFDDCPEASSNRRVVNVQGDGGCPSNPGKATLVAPAANATSLASPVTFDWNPVPNATGYRVLAAFGNGESESLGVTNAQTTQLTVKLPVGSGAWLVQTFFGEDCPTTLSERRAFTVTQGASCPTTAPQLISPPNGTATVSSPVLFDWSDVPDAAGYAVFVNTRDGNDDFSLYGTTDAGTTQLERLIPNGEIDWYVVARFTGCPDVRSAIFTFGTDTECKLGDVQILTPEANAEVSSPVTVSWSPVPNATSYRVTLKTASGAIALSSRTTTTNTTLRLPAGSFIVHVEALRDDCQSSSAERRFKVREGENCASNAAPVLVSPVGTESQPVQAQSPVTLTWIAVANAIGYRVWVARDEEPFEDVALTAQTSDEVELEPGRYRWFIQALFEGCEPTRSAIAYFVIPDSEGCTRAAPQVISPANGATVPSPVTIDWSGVDGARKYRVLALVNDRPTLLGVTEETELTRALFPGDYVLVVQAEFEECASTESARTQFTVRRAQSCPTEAPQLVSPANGATNTDPEVEFVWTPVSGAIQYAVVAKVNDGSETILGTTNGTQLRRRVPPGKITWSVIAILGGCDPLRAQPFTFSVPRPQNCPDRKPVALFPTGDHGNVQSPVEFAWLGVPGAIEYRIWVPQGSPVMIATTTETHAKVELPPGPYRWYVEARFGNSCPSAFSAESQITVIEAQPCGKPARPEANVIGQALSGVAYQLRWTPLPNVSSYEVQEATSLDFENAASFTSSSPSMKFTHEVTGAPVQYLYRVRGVSDCGDERGPYSAVVGVFVIEAKTNNASSELGTASPIVQKVFLPGGSAPQQFTVKTDKPWLTVTPSGGTLPVEGLTLTVTADPNHLGIGTNTATLQVTYAAGAAKGVARNDETTVSLPLSLSLVTPVTPSGKGTPPPDALIFAAVGHAAGVNDSLFESDIRLTNLTAQTMKYDLNFTPSGLDGTTNGITSTIEVPPGVTMGLDDVVASAFGEGTIGSSLGMLEVRPVTTSESGGIFGSINDAAQQQIHTVASSRTYNFTPNGTFGQFIPATPFANFVGQGTILSLQQIAQSVAYRANFGFLEASGQPVNLSVRVYDTANNLLATIPVSLGAMQHRQMNGLLQNNGINNLTDGRVEVEVTSGDGKVTAYVSEVDNATNDPLLVSPVVKGAVVVDRTIVPGMAYLNTGSAFWVSDLRIFNAGTTATPATLTFYPMGNPAGAMTREITVDAGEIEVLDNVLVNTFGKSTDAGGSIVITTPEPAALTATARTYNQTSSGTYGQFIPGVTVAESIGLGDRALQVLQVEQSTRIRTNIGLNETTGQPATVEISLITPDSLTTPVVTIGLKANEFRQIGLVDFGMPDAVYNGRVTVKVIGGEGKVTAYGSAIDQITQDPTYVPAQ